MGLFKRLKKGGKKGGGTDAQAANRAPRSEIENVDTTNFTKQATQTLANGGDNRETHKKQEEGNNSEDDSLKEKETVAETRAKIRASVRLDKGETANLSLQEKLRMRAKSIQTKDPVTKQTIGRETVEWAT